MKPRSRNANSERPASISAGAGTTHPRGVTLDLAGALGQPAADRRIDILRRIGAGGSISEAARSAGVSYRAAWQAIETLGNLAGRALVEKVVGGSGGGGARLTDAGQRVLEVAERLEAARRAVLNGEPDNLTGLTLRTSLRNLLRCHVRSVESRRGLAVVSLRTPAGDTLRSSITRESAELLGLRAGFPVLALFKATAVQIEAGQTSAGSAPSQEDCNLMTGRIVSGSEQTSGEWSLQLSGGERITGFAEAHIGLNAPALARFSHSAVVIAIA